MTLTQFHNLQVGERFSDIVYPQEFNWVVRRRANDEHVLRASYREKSNGVIDIAWETWPSSPLSQPERIPLVEEEW